MIYKVAIIGCGLISTLKYLPGLKKLSNRVKIVGICDLSEDLLRKTSSSFAISSAYQDFTKMLDEQKPDITIVLTPPAAHTKVVIKSLEMGSHVLVEKPMALTEADCTKMLDASDKCDRKLGVMHNQVFNPAFEKAYKIVASGEIGSFVGMRIMLMTSVHDMTEDPSHWAHRLPGGVLGETGPHATYLSLAFLKNVQDVCIISKKHLPQYPWSIGEDFRFDIIADNGISSVALMYGSNQTSAEVDIICSKGYLKVDLQTRIMVSHNRLQDKPLISSKNVMKSVVTNVYQTASSFLGNGIQYSLSRNLDGHFIGLNRFLDYVAGKADFPAKAEDGREVERVMELLVEKIGCANETVMSPARATLH